VEVSVTMPGALRVDFHKSISRFRHLYAHYGMLKTGHALVLLALIAVHSADAQAKAAVPADIRHADSLYDRHDYPNAARAYRVVLAAAPNDGRSWYRLGASLAAENDPRSAAEAFERSASIGHQILAMYNAAAMRARLGEQARALAWIDSALAAGFSGDSLLRTDADFASLRGDPGFQRRIATAERAFRPCRSRPESHLFDFWIGEWDVTNAQGQPAGRSSVQQILSQCVIFENWTDRQGGEGKSFNAYNTDYNMWQQFWSDQYGRVTEYRESERTPEDGLRFLAHQRLPQGPSLIRMTFTPIDANTVRQFGEISADSGKTWKTSFDLYYHRKGRRSE
jgi:tetratricopeptide (TPR) repeat protein